MVLFVGHFKYNIFSATVHSQLGVSNTIIPIQSRFHMSTDQNIKLKLLLINMAIERTLQHGQEGNGVIFMTILIA